MTHLEVKSEAASTGQDSWLFEEGPNSMQIQHLKLDLPSAVHPAGEVANR